MPLDLTETTVDVATTVACVVFGLWLFTRFCQRGRKEKGAAEKTAKFRVTHTSVLLRENICMEMEDIETALKIGLFARNNAEVKRRASMAAALCGVLLLIDPGDQETKSKQARARQLIHTADAACRFIGQPTMISKIHMCAASTLSRFSACQTAEAMNAEITAFCRIFDAWINDVTRVGVHHFNAQDPAVSLDRKADFCAFIKAAQTTRRSLDALVTTDVGDIETNRRTIHSLLCLVLSNFGM